MAVLLSSIHLHVVLKWGAFYFLVLSASNIVWLRITSRRARITEGPKVSVLIPARNERRNIGRCLDSLLSQSYANFEIIVLDDQSSDGTWDVVFGYQQRYPELVTAVRGGELPSGWTGKAHAMQQLFKHAQGEYLFYTDADTVHGENSISWAVTNLESHRADFLSGYVFQDLRTFGEHLIVPATYIMSALILPLWLIPVTRLPALSFAIGQLIVVRRKALEAVDGYASIADHISDDIYMARRMKEAGFRTIFLDVRKNVRCRMYEGYAASCEGFSKNIFDFFKNRPVFFAAALSILVVFALLPAAFLAVHWLDGTVPTDETDTTILFFLLAWSLTLYDRGLRWWVPFLYPLLFLNLLYMAWRGVGSAAAGHGVVWKGRTIR